MLEIQQPTNQGHPEAPTEDPRYTWLKGATEEQVDEAYDLGLKQIAAYDALISRTDTKATGLFGVIGFCMTLAISFGGWSLLDNVRKVPFGGPIAVCFLVVLGIGVWAGRAAVAVLRVRDLAMVSETQVFKPGWMNRPTKDYRAVLTAHIWSVALQNHGVSDEKANELEKGQKAFLYFLGGLLVLSTLTVVSALKRAKDVADPTPVQVTCCAGSASADSKQATNKKPGGSTGREAIRIDLVCSEEPPCY